MSTARQHDNHMFSGNRERAIQRDKEKCTSCEMSRDQHYRTFGDDLNVHHIDGKGCHTHKSDKNNTIDNLITLCRVCHGKEDGKRSLGKRNARRRFTKEQISEIRSLCEEGTITQTKIAEMYKTTQSHVWMINKHLIYRND